MTGKYAPVTNPAELADALARVRKAQRAFSSYSQEQVDAIFLAAATAANQARITLAKLAVAETGMGVVEDKVIKNHYASEYIYNAYKHEKTCGVLEEDHAYGIQKIAEPIGVVAAVSKSPQHTHWNHFEAHLCAQQQRHPPWKSGAGTILTSNVLACAIPLVRANP